MSGANGAARRNLRGGVSGARTVCQHGVRREGQGEASPLGKRLSRSELVGTRASELAGSLASEDPSGGLSLMTELQD